MFAEFVGLVTILTAAIAFVWHHIFPLSTQCIQAGFYITLGSLLAYSLVVELITKLKQPKDAKEANKDTSHIA